MTPTGVANWIQSWNLIREMLAAPVTSAMHRDAPALGALAEKRSTWQFLVTTTGYLDSIHGLKAKNVEEITEALVQKKISPLVIGMRDYLAAIEAASSRAVLSVGPTIAARTVGPPAIYRASRFLTEMDIRHEACERLCGGNLACLRRCLGIERSGVTHL